MTKLITIQNKPEWVTYVRNAAEYDFYHTWHYHSLEVTGKPILFVYQEQEDYIAYPFIKREIPGSDYYDLTCVYGYSGPISNKKMDELNDSLVENFMPAFLNFLSEEKCISVFSRLHPFFNQHKLMEKFGGVHENGPTVALDLSVSIEDQRKKYRQSTMDAIKHAWKKGYTVKQEKGEAAIATFLKIYTETMLRVGASESYLFNDAYFARILNTTEYDARILMVYDGNTVMCATIITFTNGIIQAHLMGTLTAYLHKSPAKLLVDEITIIGRELGMRYYNLGGGLGFKKDAIFTWKTAFSDLQLDFRSWRFIANPTVYQHLLDEKGIDRDAAIDFFPLYRYN
jgi:hypothetical protein